MGRGKWKEEKSKGMKMKVKWGEGEYSCSLYVVSPEFELVELKAKSVLRSEGAVTRHIQHRQPLTPVEAHTVLRRRGSHIL
jgi:hypothetical protein